MHRNIEFVDYLLVRKFDAGVLSRIDRLMDCRCDQISVAEVVVTAAVAVVDTQMDQLLMAQRNSEWVFLVMDKEESKLESKVDLTSLPFFARIHPSSRVRR